MLGKPSTKRGGERGGDRKRITKDRGGGQKEFLGHGRGRTDLFHLWTAKLARTGGALKGVVGKKRKRECNSSEASE